MVKHWFEQYPRYRFESITQRRFSFDQFHQWLMSFEKASGINIEQIGNSIEQRPIYHVSVGNGDKKIMLWSQMHGNEATATMALFDLFNFLLTTGDGNDEFREQLLSAYSLHFIPVVNPDGMERFQRFNAIGVDLNRDARALICPESKILKAMVERLQPAFGFNLHDQEIYYTAGEANKEAIISFLAPREDLHQAVSETRKNAMKVIAQLNQELQEVIPGHVAKYYDDYEPRAFGECIQQLGTSTILVESGGLRGDVEKQEIRRLNFSIFLGAFESILERSFQKYPLEQYEDIPFNGKHLFDLIIRNVLIDSEKEDFRVDIAIKRNEVTQGNLFYHTGTIEAIGDLNNYYGYEEFDANSARLIIGKISASNPGFDLSVGDEEIRELLSKGITHVTIKETNGQLYSNKPINFVHKSNHQQSFEIGNEQPANFVLKTAEGIQKAVINGFLVDLEDINKFSGNTPIQ